MPGPYLFDHVPEQRVAVVRIRQHLSRRADLGRQVRAKIGAERVHLLVGDGRCSLQTHVEACGVGHEVEDGDGPPEPGWDLHVAQVAVHRRIELQTAHLDQLHDGGGGERLGEGADAKDRLVRRPCAGGQVGKAVALREQDAIALHDRHGRSRGTGRAIAEARTKPPIGPSFQVVGFNRRRGRPSRLDDDRRHQAL